MNVCIAAGGTGGHLYPGIALAQELMRQDEKSQVQFVGTPRGLEARVLPTLDPGGHACRAHPEPSAVGDACGAAAAGPRVLQGCAGVET